MRVFVKINDMDAYVNLDNIIAIERDVINDNEVIKLYTGFTEAYIITEDELNKILKHVEKI